MIHAIDIGFFDTVSRESDPPKPLLGNLMRPFAASELAQMEHELAQRFGFFVQLERYVTDQGGLRIFWSEAEGAFAWHVAAIGSELFATVCGEYVGRDVHPPESLGCIISRSHDADMKRLRLSKIRDDQEWAQSLISYVRNVSGLTRRQAVLKRRAALFMVDPSRTGALSFFINGVADPEIAVREFSVAAIGCLGARAAKAIGAERAGALPQELL